MAKIIQTDLHIKYLFRYFAPALRNLCREK